VPHRENQQAVSWASIFAPRILQQFISNHTAAANSTSFTITSPIYKTLLTQFRRFLHHRETCRTDFVRERRLSRLRERYSSVARVDLVHVSLSRHSADLAARRGSLQLPRADRRLSNNTRSNIRTTLVSNKITRYARYSISSFKTTVTPAMRLRESRPLASRCSIESRRLIQRTDMVWRQPPVAAKVESQDVRRSFPDTSQNSRVMAFESPGSNKTSVKTMERSAASAFSAAQMDRVVDNVIGRVEKRLRIERERRGR
jgi:hypothetical protein